MRRIGVEERRARLGRRHGLARLGAQAGARSGAAGLAETARSLVGLHATDPASVFLAAWARVEGVTPRSVEHELYDRRSVVRMLGMRRTMFVVPVDLVAVVHESSTRAIAARERRKLVRFLGQSGLAADPGRWLREVEEETFLALLARGEATGTELAREVPALQEKVQLAEGTRWATQQNLSTRVLFMLAADGRIVRGRPRGTWISSQHRWAPMASMLPEGMPELAPEVAQAELVRRWLHAFGPGTVADLTWWTGWGAREVRRALADVGPVEVDLDGTTGLVLADDDHADDGHADDGHADGGQPGGAAEPWVALLPALDSTPMGWQARDWFLGGHGPALFDRTGNIGPTVWSDGRIVGGWGQRRHGEVAFRLLEDIGAEAEGKVVALADRLAGWIGAVRVTPRFRTPLEREITT